VTSRIDQTDRVYAAEQTVEIRWFEDVADANARDSIAPVEIPGFIEDTLVRSGRKLDRLPTVEWDVADDDWCAGWFDSVSLHLHPALARRSLVLHELAHWLMPDVDGHGPSWAAAYLALMTVGLGADFAASLAEEFRATGVAVDRRWAGGEAP
jgi:hypothetical protein